MRKILLLILFFAFLIGGWWYASAQNLLPEQARLAIPDFNQGESQDQLTVFGSRAQALGGYVQGFFSQNVQTNNQQSLGNKAVQYGQYLYCKQVVETYETNNSGN